ncbi:GntR family transcriptional regulator [Oceanobacillus timonensis]|uniref:GntR family transcriptional regulator n=1 Tax=Oceanobacillus timonensis TaxID=1926285 RepID=UPI0009B95B67|nr:GntR family transcriptional regulator [Oceanobacillus timonensis]
MSRSRIEPNKGEALYLQVKNELYKRIQSGLWKADTLIPTEQDLISEFDVSRTTIRQAINLLVQDNLLEKKQGKGTVVRPQNLVGHLGKLKGFTEEARERGQIPKAKVLRSEFKSTFFFEKDMLDIPEEEPILLVERIRLADDVPIAIERSCWPKDIGELLQTHNLNEAHYYEILEQHHVYLKRAKETIRAINATMDEADYLGIRPGEALLEMTKVSYGMDDRPIEYTKTRYRSDKYQYSIELKR